MIYGLIPQELHAQLLDDQNYQNRTSGVEELKNVLLELDLQRVSSGSIVEFIQFLRKLLDDSNFKVLYGALQLINLLIEKLDCDVQRYYKEIVGVTVRALGDSRNVMRHEYMNVFRQLMRMVGPQKVLDLVVAQLKHRNSRVREDTVNIITAAMLTHPRKDFDIPGLCAEAAPALADSKKKVRHAALELFAVFDYCLDTGKNRGGRDDQNTISRYDIKSRLGMHRIFDRQKLSAENGIFLVFVRKRKRDENRSCKNIYNNIYGTPHLNPVFSASSRTIHYFDN